MTRGRPRGAHRNTATGIRKAEITLWLEKSQGRAFDVESVAAQFGVPITGVRSLIAYLRSRGWQIPMTKYGEFVSYRVLRAGPDKGGADGTNTAG